jgi:DNA-binding transcriptional LysR family regulator
VELNESVVDLVAARVDVGVRIGRVTDDSVVGRKLATYRRLLVASPRHLAAHGTPRTPADCARHTCVLRTGHDEWRFERGKQVVTVRVTGTYRTDALELVRHAALADAGLAIVPSFAVAADIAAGRLVRLLQRFEPELAIYAVYSNPRHLAPSARAFVDFLVAEVPARLASK